MLVKFDSNYENEFIIKVKELVNNYFDMGDDWSNVKFVNKIDIPDNKGDITTFEYEFDIYGNKIKEINTDSQNIVSISSYLYNKDNQLTEKLIDSKVSEKYKYDDNGNLISKTTPCGTYTYTYTPDNKLEDTYLDNKLESRYIYNTNNLKSYELLRKEYPYDYEVDDSYYNNLKKLTVELDENRTIFNLQKDVVKDTNDVIPEVIKPKSFIDHVLSFFGAIGSAISGFFIGLFHLIFGGNNKTEIKEENTVSDSIDYDTIDVDYFIPFLKSKTLRKLNKLFHQEDDIQVILEPSKYTYDYTSENPLILSNYDSNYTYLNDRLLEDSKSNKSYLYDGKYSVSEVISKDNTLSLRYDIYGNILTPLSQEDKTFSYNTLEYTPQNNLYYVRARYYDPSLSSFISKDTYLGNIYKPITTNRYAYCSGDPVNNMDLDGHRFDDKGHEFDFVKPSYSKPTTPANKPSSGGKKPSYTPSGSNIVITYEDSGGHEHVYIPDPRQYYLIKYYLKKYASTEDALGLINKTLFGEQSNSLKQIVFFDSDNNKPSNYSVLTAATSSNLSESAKETIENNIGVIKYRNSLGEIYYNKAKYYCNGEAFGDIKEEFEEMLRDDYNDLFPNTPQLYKEPNEFKGRLIDMYVSCGATSAEMILTLFNGSSLDPITKQKYEMAIINDAGSSDFTNLGFLTNEINKYCPGIDYSWFGNSSIDEESLFNMYKSATDDYYPVIIKSKVTSDSDFGYESAGHYYVAYNFYVDDEGTKRCDISDPYDPNHYKEPNSQKLKGIEFSYIYEQSMGSHYSIVPSQYNINDRR